MKLILAWVTNSATRIKSPSFSRSRRPPRSPFCLPQIGDHGFDGVEIVLHSTKSAFDALTAASYTCFKGTFFCPASCLHDSNSGAACTTSRRVSKFHRHFSEPGPGCRKLAPEFAAFGQGAAHPEGARLAQHHLGKSVRIPFGAQHREQNARPALLHLNRRVKRCPAPPRQAPFHKNAPEPPR